MTVGMAHLHALYATSDDPWDFATSSYEQEKFRATRAALSKRRYAAGLEIGCGNGALAKHLAPCCSRYTGLDAVGKAIETAEQAVPSARFVQAFYPCPLPDDDYDLIIVSEFLYFLDPSGIQALARRISDRWSAAEVICVTYLGDTGNQLQGRDALQLFMASLATTHRFQTCRHTAHYRIDRGIPGDDQ